MIVAIIPARGGSKRIPRKNLAPLLGKPMLEYTIEAALASAGTGRVFVSTEDDEITRVATAAGAGVIPRPTALASDVASTESVLLHALQQREVAALSPRWIMTLAPTSPLRDGKSLVAFLGGIDLDRADVDCYFSVTEDYSYFWRKHRGGTWQPLFTDAPRRQQDREPLFVENSAIYLTRVTALNDTGFIHGRRSIGVTISRESAIDINDPIDLQIAQQFLRSQEAR